MVRFVRLMIDIIVICANEESRQIERRRKNMAAGSMAKGGGQWNRINIRNDFIRKSAGTYPCVWETEEG